MEELKKAPVTVLLILANILVFTAVEFTGGSDVGHDIDGQAAAEQLFATGVR